MKTFMASPATIERKWYVVDATDMTLGRMASEVAKVLRGKNKPTFTPFIDTRMRGEDTPPHFILLLSHFPGRNGSTENEPNVVRVQ